MPPLIALTPLLDEKLNRPYMDFTYFDAIFAAGGTPVMLPITTDPQAWEEYLNTVDGIVFTGGQDVSPVLYKQTPLENMVVSSLRRDSLEYGLCKRAIEKDKVILGICRGEQLLNVVCGGTLYQDITTFRPSALTHRQTVPSGQTVHDVKVVQDSPLYQLLNKSRFAVNSSHHQGIDKLGEGLIVMAKATDDLIEGVYMPEKKFVWGVQWHPERLYSTSPECLAILKEFVRYASIK